MRITSISGNFNRITSDDNSYYLISASGLVVIDKLSEQEVAYCNTTYNFTDVWTASGVNKVFISTSGDGLLSVIKGTGLEGNLEEKLHIEAEVPDISSDVILSVHGNTLGNVLIGTASGVDFISEEAIYGQVISEIAAARASVVASQNELKHGLNVLKQIFYQVTDAGFMIGECTEDST